MIRHRNMFESKRPKHAAELAKVAPEEQSGQWGMRAIYQKIATELDLLTNAIDRGAIARIRLVVEAIKRYETLVPEETGGKMKALIEERRVGRILSLRVDVGQYLPDWRPQADYRRQVSANRALGGGVLLELSHELDYVNWLFGRFDRVFCVTANSGQLEIDVEDNVDILLSRDGLTAQIHLDFLQRRASRSCKVIGSSGTLHWDLIANRITLDSPSGEDVLFSDPTVDRNDMYVEQLRGFIEVAAGHAAPRITLNDGLAVLNMIEAMRESAATGRQVPLPVEGLATTAPFDPLFVSSVSSRRVSEHMP
jgi:hypothetical protein